MRRRSSRILLGAIVIVPALAIALWGGRFSRFQLSSPTFQLARESTSTLQAIFFDIGQGDSFLLRDPAGNDLLVDGGPTDAVLGKLGKYLPPTDRTI